MTHHSLASPWSQANYDKAMRFAAYAHGEQKVPGTPISYVMHLSLVTMETMTALAHTPGSCDADLAIACALLHDTIEDTDVTYEDVHSEFGLAIADGVLALTKDKNLPTKQEQMEDSLHRIVEQPKEVWMVKLADRITNLAPPPNYWKNHKRRKYHVEAQLIWDKLHAASPFLAARLQQRIENYTQYFDE
ncbi:MAG: bifunctional (p)ppGpp synthetase/guanosine-3',5'-bis(diphosphate) 3'-pyrophosphohydrolase [Deltaproteobacteria bacterium]|nr:MAG: bifunctional (p)ppGpp synthetase/guanosine-3',5'-bis(diphosphate) 3'-pyrophosphohydrolase [Deltaproteobacteria bacterium]